MRDLTVTPEAEEDLTLAHNWYEKQRSGLGEEFLGCVDATLERIVRLPHAFPVVHEPFRRVLIRRFPYAIYFESLEDRIVVYGAFHGSRDPDTWRQRLSR